MTAIEHDLTVHYVPADAVDLYPGNARKGDTEAIKESMDENGVFAPVVVQRSTGFVIDGNHRLKAMRKAGLANVPVIYLDVDDDQAKRIVLAANRTNDLASYDDRALVELLESLPDLEGTGYVEDDLTDLLVALESEVQTIAADTEDVTRVAPTGKDRHGETGDREYPEDSRTPTAESYAAAATRMMILNYPLEQFAWVQEQLEELCKDRGWESNSDAVLRLVEAATGNTAPRTEDDADEEGEDEPAEDLGEAA